LEKGEHEQQAFPIFYILNYKNRETKRRYLLLLSSLRCYVIARILGWVEK
jgi:hypothetical protein